MVIYSGFSHENVIFHSYVSLPRGYSSDWVNEVGVFEIDSLMTFLWKVKTTLMAEENLVANPQATTSTWANHAEPRKMRCFAKNNNQSTFIIYPLVN